MKSVVEIIKAHGGMDALIADPIRIDRPCESLMPLTVQVTGNGFRGGTLVSVSHWYTQNGDVMRDPEMEFEVPAGDLWSNQLLWDPVSYTQHPGIEQVAVFREGDEVLVRTGMQRGLRRFMRTWDRNIGEQGYLAKFHEQRNSVAP